MKNIFVVADTHFVLEQFRNPYYRYGFARRWNKRVQKNDLVIHLGDVAWSERTLALFDYLNGRKILVMGNHDTFKVVKYKEYFEECHSYYLYKNILFSHEPMCPIHTHRHIVNNDIVDIRSYYEQYASTIRANIHGHFHEYGMTKFKQHSKAKYDESYDKQMHDSVPYPMFCVDTALPIKLTSILRQVRKMKKKQHMKSTV